MPLTLEDRIQIQDLLTRYTYLVDYGGTEQDFLETFTEDAVLKSPISGLHEGIEGVKKFAQRTNEMRKDRQTRHYATNFAIDGNGNEGTLKAHVLQFMTKRNPPPGQEKVTEFQLSGNYDCRVRKVNGRWRISNRTVHVDVHEK